MKFRFPKNYSGAGGLNFLEVNSSYMWSKTRRVCVCVRACACVSGKKKYFTINFIHSTHKHVRFYLLLPISVTTSIFTFSTFILHSLQTSPILFIVVLQHNIISPIRYFGPFTVSFGEMCCHSVMIHID